MACFQQFQIYARMTQQQVTFSASLSIFSFLLISIVNLFFFCFQMHKPNFDLLSYILRTLWYPTLMHFSSMSKLFFFYFLLGITPIFYQNKTKQGAKRPIHYQTLSRSILKDKNRIIIKAQKFIKYVLDHHQNNFFFFKVQKLINLITKLQKNNNNNKPSNYVKQRGKTYKALRSWAR